MFSFPRALQRTPVFRKTARIGRRAAQTLALLLVAAVPAHGEEVMRGNDRTPYCGDEGVWLQILGAGGAELDDGETSASYAVFLDNSARLIVDPAPGAAGLFDRSGGRVNDLDAIVLSHTGAERAADLPAFLLGSMLAGRNRLLPVLGPAGDKDHLGVTALLDRLVGPAGAFPALSTTLPADAVGRFRASAREVTASGQRRWSDFSSANLRLEAVPAHHGDVPSLIWAVTVGGKRIVFAGDTNNLRNNLTAFAKDADALVIHHSIPDNARGTLTEFHMAPSQIGQIAAEAGVRMVILGHRMNRTRGRETLTTQAIEAHYQGSLIFANDLECWGL